MEAASPPPPPPEKERTASTDAAAAAAIGASDPAPHASPSPGADAADSHAHDGESPATTVIQEASKSLAAVTPAVAAAAAPSASSADSAGTPAAAAATATTAAAAPAAAAPASSSTKTASVSSVRRRGKKAAPRPSAGGLAIGFTAEELRAQAAKRAAWMREEVTERAALRSAVAAANAKTSHYGLMVVLLLWIMVIVGIFLHVYLTMQRGYNVNGDHVMRASNGIFHEFRQQRDDPYYYSR